MYFKSLQCSFQEVYSDQISLLRLQHIKSNIGTSDTMSFLCLFLFKSSSLYSIFVVPIVQIQNWLIHFTSSRSWYEMSMDTVSGITYLPGMFLSPELLKKCCTELVAMGWLGIKSKLSSNMKDTLLSVAGLLVAFLYTYTYIQYPFFAYLIHLSNSFSVDQCTLDFYIPHILAYALIIKCCCCVLYISAGSYDLCNKWKKNICYSLSHTHWCYHIRQWQFMDDNVTQWI